MAEETPRRNLTPRNRGGAQPPPHPPGWKVTPAPDGRGQPKQGASPPSRPNSRWLIVLLVLGLLALNLWISSQALKPNPRVRIPYYPTFITQLKDGNVTEITSTADAIQGTFKTKVKYPANDKGAQPTTDFATQVPSFANRTQLSNLLEQQNVTTDAHTPDTGPSFLESLIYGFGPTLLLILLFFFIMRRAASAAGGAGGIMSFGRSRARRVEGSSEPVTFKDVAGIDEAKEELTEIVDFLQNPDKYLRLGG